MGASKSIIFEPIIEEDITQLTDIMTRAFDKDTQQFLGDEKGGPPGYDTGVFIRKWAIESPTESFKIRQDGHVIGAVIVRIHDNHENRLGCLFIDPELHSKGIGLKIWQKVEERYPLTKKWTTETPGYSKRNHHFYINKCGFKVVKILNPFDIREECYVMEKEM